MRTRSRRVRGMSSPRTRKAQDTRFRRARKTCDTLENVWNEARKASEARGTKALRVRGT